jgi:hypothetical protein
MPNEVKVASLNPSFPLLCEHVKKKKNKNNTKETKYRKTKENIKQKTERSIGKGSGAIWPEHR